MAQLSPRVVVTPPPICNSSNLRKELTELFPETRFNDKGRYLNEEELIRFTDEADALIIGRDPLNDRVLSALPALKFVSKYGVGLDTIDQKAMQNRGIELGWTEGVNRRSVAELTLGFMLSLCHNIFSGGEALKRGKWVKDGGRMLEGKTVGIIGCGNIGMEVVRLLKPFDCRVWVCDIVDKSELCRETGAESKSFLEILRGANIISLHVPLNGETRHMIDKNALHQMRFSAFLINTSRGEVVDQEALKAALKKGAIGGAALDVFAQEPPEDMELLSCSNLMVTPHIGGNAVEAVEAMARAAFGHLKKFFNFKE